MAATSGGSKFTKEQRSRGGLTAAANRRSARAASNGPKLDM